MTGSTRKILVVDDEPEIAAALAIFARSEGYEALVANDGVAALEIIEGEVTLDVILLDISLPGVDGRDVLARARERRLQPQAVVIFVTARDDQSDRLVGLELGADEYETKPLRFRTLFRKIDHLLAKRRIQPARGPAAG